MAEAKPTSNVTPISADSTLSDAQKRDQLRAKIEAGEKRNEARTLMEQAKDAKDTALEFTKKHPLAVLGGAVVVGLAIGAMTKRGRRVGRRGGMLAGMALDAALAYGARAMDSAGTAAQLAGDKFEDFGDRASTAARGLRRDASYKLEVAGDTLKTGSRRAVRTGSRKAKALKDRFKH